MSKKSVTVTYLPNLLSPQDRQTESHAWVPGMDVESLLADLGVDASSGVAVWKNGRLLKDGLGVPLSPRDIIHYGHVPGGFLAPVLPYIITAVVVAAVGYVVLKSMLPQPQQDPASDELGDGTYGYYGFRNSYRSEGDVIPIVYGEMRFAPPVMNKSITSGTVANSTGGVPQLTQSSTELLNVSLCIGHGPIEGIGIYSGDVFDGQDFTDLTGGDLLQTKIGAGLEVNGIQSGQFPASLTWRTGGLEQEPILGLLSSVDVSNAAAGYFIGFKFDQGTESIDESAFPPGVYPYASRITAPTSEEYVSQFISTEADSAVIQLLFERGLFSGADLGDPQNKTSSYRIQYYATDITGSATSDVVILPQIDVSAATFDKFSVDYQFDLFNPSTVQFGGQEGYAQVVGYNDRTPAAIQISNNAGLAAIRPTPSSNGKCSFTFSAWVWGTSEAHVSGNQNQYLTRELHLFSWHSRRDYMETLYGTPGSFVPGTGYFADFLRPHDDVVNVSAPNGMSHVIISIRKIWNSEIESEADQPWQIIFEYSSKDASFNNGVRLAVSSFSFGDEIGDYLAWRHIGVSYDSELDLCSFYIDGLLLESKKMSTSEFYTSPTWVDRGPLFNIDFSGPGNSSCCLGTTYKIDTVDNAVRWYGSQGGTAAARAQVGLAQVLLYDGLIYGSQGGVAQHMAACYFTRDAANNPTYDISQLASVPELRDGLLICAPLNTSDSYSIGANSYYRNYADSDFDDSVSSESDGHFSITKPLLTVGGGGPDLPQNFVPFLGGGNYDTSSGPIFGGSVGRAEKEYYYIEVFKSGASVNETEERDVATLDSITVFSRQEFQYPGIAYAACRIEGTEQIGNSEPAVTLLVRGRKVPVYPGGGSNSIGLMWSRNPAWVALDILSNRTWGLGDVFNKFDDYDGIDLDQFLDWARFCDEGTRDGFGSSEFFGLKTYYDSGSSDSGLLLYFGVTDSAGNADQVIPDSWSIGKAISIESVNIPILSSFVTKDDVIGGKNDSSNMMGITDVRFEYDQDFHGYSAYLVVTCSWNRIDPSGAPVWPSGVASGDEFFYDDYSGYDALGSAYGYEKRCEFDGVINSKEKTAWDSVIDVFQCGRAMPVLVGNKIMPVWDRPRDPSAMFTMGNIVEGSVSIDYISYKTSPNTIEVELLDRDHNYERRNVLVDHPSVQDPSSFENFRKERYSAVGVTRRTQATRDATYRLNKYYLQRRSIEFEVGPDSLNILPGDRVLLAHDVPQYGTSGRLPEGFTYLNSHPGASSIFASWTQEGGQCALTEYSLLEETAQSAPISGYPGGVVLAYSLPVAFDGQSYSLAGEASSDGYNLTPKYIGQYVANSSSLYPSPDNSSGLISPLDQILATNEVKEFSVYVKEPLKGASKSVLVNVYRYSDEEGYVRANHGVRFDWSSGSLVFGAYFGDYNGDHGSGTSSPYGLSYQIQNIGSGWFRATVFYDNGAPTGGGADARGDYIQARVAFAHNDGAAATFLDAPLGRYSNLIRYGDPFNVDGKYQGASVWTKINDSFLSNNISHDTSVAPVFYPDDISSDAGKRGYVLNIRNSATSGGSNPAITQIVSIPSDWPGSLGVGDLTNEAICLSFYVKLAADNAATNATVYVRMGISNSTGAAPSGWYDEDYAQWRASNLGGTPLLVYNDQETTAVVTEVNSSITPVYLNSTSDDPDWYRVDVAASFDQSFSDIYLTVGLLGNSGGDSSIDIWGLRLHGEAGLGSTGVYVNENTHRGSLLWGPLYAPDSDGSVSDWSNGGLLKLDRPVTLESGNEYEVYMRSTASSSGQGDGTEAVEIDSSEVPTSGSVVIPARTAIKVSAPTRFTPRTGDLYSFGKTGSSVEDLVVSSIDVNPETLNRKVRCFEYVPEVYDDTSFGTISDPTISSAFISSDDSSRAKNGLGSAGVNAGFDFSAKVHAFRGEVADSKIEVDVSVDIRGKVAPYRSLKIFLSQKVGSSFSAPVLVGELPAGQRHYRFSSDYIRPGQRYRVTAQMCGEYGGGRSLALCPYVDIYANVAAPIPAAPTVSVATDGFTQVYEVDAAQSKAVTSVEGRIGGWVISTPAYAGDPRQDTFTSLAGIAIGVTNSAGETNLPVYSRARLANGRYGIAAITDHTTSFKDFETSEEEAAEDDYTSIMAVPVGLTVTPGGVLTWQAASSLLEVNCPMTNIYDLGTARRVLPVALIQGYQVRPETLADCTFALGSETGRRWSLEGPMDDPDSSKDNASVKIEWRWSSTGSVAAEDWVPFRPQEVYLRTCQFRLVWTRPTADYQVRLQRFVTKLYVAPKFEPEDVDGGTF